MVLQNLQGDTMVSSYQLGQILQRDTMSSRSQLNLDIGDQNHSRFLPLDKRNVDCMRDERRLVTTDLEQSNANNQYITQGKLFQGSNQGRILRRESAEYLYYIDSDKNQQDYRQRRYRKKSVKLQSYASASEDKSDSDGSYATASEDMLDSDGNSSELSECMKKRSNYDKPCRSTIMRQDESYQLKWSQPPVDNTKHRVSDDDTMEDDVNDRFKEVKMRPMESMVRHRSYSTSQKNHNVDEMQHDQSDSMDDGHNYISRGQRCYYNQGYQSSSSSEDEDVNKSLSSVDTQMSTQLHFDGQAIRIEDSCEQKGMSPAKRRCYNISESSENARCLDVKSWQKSSRSDYTTDRQQTRMQTNDHHAKQPTLTHGAETVQPANNMEFRDTKNRPVEIKARTTSGMTSYDVIPERHNFICISTVRC